MRGLKINKKHGIVVLALVCGIALVHIAPVVIAAEPNTGTAIYDQTYIDAKETEIKKLFKSEDDEIKKKLSDMEKAYNDKLVATENEMVKLRDSMQFKIIKLPAGKILIGGASTEIIVRNKNRVTAYVEKSATGGVSNLISGKDIKHAEIIPDNQLLLIPKEDGRGIKAKSDADIMVKGTYTIK